MTDAAILEHVLCGRVASLERLTVSQFRQMLEQGILLEGQPVELIDGLIVRKDRSDTGGDPMTHGPQHARCIKKLERLGRRMESEFHHLQCQLPITLSDTLEPEPDGAVVRGTLDDYTHQHPGSSDVLMVIEASDSSLEYDRTSKQRVYASASIPVYWIINVVERRIEVYENPQAPLGKYGRRTDFSSGSSIRLTLGASSIDVGVDELLP
jgi:Uma2 family endonuclease